MLKTSDTLPIGIWEDQFLNWFSLRGGDLLETVHEFGGLRIFQFQNQFQVLDGRTCSAFGLSEVRKLALIKCAAESVERESMIQYYVDFPNSTPKPLQNSNGWAVQRTAELASVAATNEVLERHLLMKSFFIFGWDGFNFHQKQTLPGMDLYFLTSRFVKSGKVAGLVIAKSTLYPGVSFGYCLGNRSEAAKTQFWLGAIYEATSKILSLKGQPCLEAPESWIKTNIKYFLENSFDLSLLKTKADPEIQCHSKLPEVQMLDLSKKMNLNFSLFAAHASGADMLPLFSKSVLDQQATDVLAPILKVNGIESLPERHPIL